MGAYLTDHPPVRDQWYANRNRPLTGCTVLHTAESLMDTLGPDTGAESVAEFIRTRTTPGSYHDLCDSDSAINLVDYRHGAYHDGTGSNNWALSISWACRTSDWRAMAPAKRKAFLRQGAIAFARQQAYRRSIGAPLTELRLITKAQSDRGESGFIYHGLRDPGRRTDPGVAAPNLFPFDEFLTEVRAVMSGQPAPTPVQGDDDMAIIDAPGRRPALIGPGYFRELSDEEAANTAPFGPVHHGNDRQYDLWVSMATAGQTILDTPIPRSAEAGGGHTTLRDQAHWEDHNFRRVTPQAVADLVTAPQVDVDALASKVAAALAAPIDLDAVFKAAQDGANSIVDNLRVVADPDA